MKEKDIISCVKEVHEAIRHRQGILSPDSNGKGHGKLLRAIAEHPGISGVELSLKMDIAPPVISEKLSGLERDGLIYRERDQKDRRRTHTYLTNDGVMALARRRHGQKLFEERVKECLNEEERKLFREMCERIVSAIETMKDETADNDTVISFYEQQKQRRHRKEQKVEKEESVE